MMYYGTPKKPSDSIQSTPAQAERTDLGRSHNAIMQNAILGYIVFTALYASGVFVSNLALNPIENKPVSDHALPSFGAACAGAMIAIAPTALAAICMIICFSSPEPCKRNTAIGFTITVQQLSALLIAMDFLNDTNLTDLDVFFIAGMGLMLADLGMIPLITRGKIDHARKNWCCPTRGTLVDLRRAPGPHASPGVRRLGDGRVVVGENPLTHVVVDSHGGGAAASAATPARRVKALQASGADTPKSPLLGDPNK